MAKPEIHVVTKRELATDDRSDRWHDPELIAPVAPVKRRALLENPFVGGDDDPVQLLGILGDRVIGRLDLVAGALDVRGETIPCCWGSAFYVPVEFRSTLVGVNLVLTQQRMNSTVGASGVSRIATGMYQNIRWREFEFPRFVLLVRSRPLVERYLGGGLVGAGSRRIFDAALSVHGGIVRASARARARGFEVEEVSEFPESLEDRLGSSDRPVAGHRSAAWINWLLRSAFEDAPTRRGLFLIVAADGTVAGYFLARARVYEEATQRQLRNLHLASLQDWAAFDPALRFEHIVLLAARELLRWKVEMIEVYVPDDETIGDLRKLGFARAGSMFTFVRADEASPLSASEFAAPSAWRLRPGDGESFFS